MDITIAIAVRNEAANIRDFTLSLIKAVENLHPSIKIETLFCINGTTDDTVNILTTELGRAPSKILNATIIYSIEGKIKAHQEILRARKKQGPLLLLDADISIDAHCFNHLIDSAEKNPQALIVYVDPIPLQTKAPKWFEKLQSAHYLHKKVLTPRSYFHGRAYLIKQPQYIANIQATTDNISTRQTRLFHLNHGPIIDDVYLSRIVAHEHGLQAIVSAPCAVVWFVPPLSLTDYYRGMYRLKLEIHRLNLLYPEHNYLQQKHFRRTSVLKELIRLPIRSLMHHLAFMIVDSAVKAAVYMRIFLINLGIKSNRNFWISLETTKKLP